jgi:drug/metabolite transporter (DMT)-like permease
VPDRLADSRATAVLFALGCTWGGSFLFIEVLVDEVSPMEVVAGRLFLGSLAVGAFMLWRRAKLVWTPWLLARMLVMATLGNVLPFGLITWGQEYIDSGLASVLNATVPIFTAVADCFPASFSRTTVLPSGSATLRSFQSLPRWWIHASCRPLKKRFGPPSRSTSGSGVLPFVSVARFW